MKRLAAVSVSVLLLAGLSAVAAQSQDDGGGGGDKQVVFDVGDPQGIDSMNPLIGVTVAAYEAWNIQYATLTDKAASDFHTIPGPRQVVEGIRRRQDLDLHAARRPQVVGRPAAHRRGHRVDDQHLARRGVDQPQRDDREPRRRRRRTTRRWS